AIPPSPPPPPVDAAVPARLGSLRVVARTDGEDDRAWARDHLTSGLARYKIDAVDDGPADGTLRAICRTAGNGLVYRDTTRFTEIEGTRVACQIDASVRRFHTSFALSGATPQSVYGRSLTDAAFSSAFSSDRMAALAAMSALALGDQAAVQ